MANIDVVHMRIRSSVNIKNMKGFQLRMTEMQGMGVLGCKYDSFIHTQIYDTFFTIFHITPATKTIQKYSQQANCQCCGSNENKDLWYTTKQRVQV